MPPFDIAVTPPTTGGGGGGGGDHGGLTGLSDDDHSQYHNNTRGDARYPQRANDLSDLASAATARTNLGLGTAALEAATAFATGAEGDLAASAVQPGDLGTAAAQDVGDFVQPGDGIDVLNSPTYDGNLVAASGTSLDNAMQAIDDLDFDAYSPAATGDWNAANQPTDQNDALDISANRAVAGRYVLLYNDVDDYEPINGGEIPDGAAREFIGDTDPSSGGGGSWTLVPSVDIWIDTSA